MLSVSRSLQANSLEKHQSLKARACCGAFGEEILDLLYSSTYISYNINDYDIA